MAKPRLGAWDWPVWTHTFCPWHSRVSRVTAAALATQPACLTSSGRFSLSSKGTMHLSNRFKALGLNLHSCEVSDFTGGFSRIWKKKMWLRVVSLRLWAVERSQAIALLLTGGFLGWSCNIRAPCDGPGPPLSLAIMHVTHDLVSCFRGREGMNGGWCWARRGTGDFGLDQISTVMLFLLLSSFGYKFLF